jgi:hypothetical protein
MRILDNSTSYECFHRAPVWVVTKNHRVKAEGSRYLLRASDRFVFGICTFNPSGTSPSPCVEVIRLKKSKKVKIMGEPVLLESSAGIVGMGQNGGRVWQGPVRITGKLQSRAKAL